MEREYLMAGTASQEVTTLPGEYLQYVTCVWAYIYAARFPAISKWANNYIAHYNRGIGTSE